MCLLLFGWKMRADLPLAVAANRDEFLSRPTAPAGFWPEAPHVLAGRDLSAGGTWMGITRGGRFAAITNYREPERSLPQAPSRGRLVASFLESREPARAFLERAIAGIERYNGFSLIAGDVEELHVLSNRDAVPLRRVEPGVHGLSNHLLDTPWPKVRRGKEALERILASAGAVEPADLLSLLRDERPALDPELPSTGVPLEWERALSPIYVGSRGDGGFALEESRYGTRSSTVVLFDGDGGVRLFERTHLTVAGRGAGDPDVGEGATVAYEMRVGVRSREESQLEMEVPDVERAP